MRMGFNSFSAHDAVNKLDKEDLSKYLDILEMKNLQRRFHKKL